MKKSGKLWFPAKRYGWGWGWPCTWQGWVVFFAYLALLLAGFALFPPQLEPGAFVAYTASISAVLIGVCYLKGERPRWRWGR
jgi:hypothetical protein